MFVSYAQNFEDVLLWRALKHVERGFYIDIGAHDPDIDSVSRAFFERGWKGLHVEPVTRHADALRAARPGDEVVEAAIATTEGSIPFYDILDTGLSTGKADLAQLHERSGLEARRIDVPSLRLSTLLDRCATQEIHWLKIDVEDMERDVIESWSPSPVRPWIVVVESTVPRSPEPNFADWETLLLTLGYEFAYFDGLNRFYVHESRSELKESLTYGANIFDAFSLTTNAFCMELARAELVRLSAIEAAANARIGELEHEVLSLRSSTSWRITKPLRRGKTVAGAILRLPGAKVRLVLAHAVLWLRRRPRIAAFLLRVVGLVPPLERRLIAFARARRSGVDPVETGWALEPDREVLAQWRRLLDGGERK